MELRSLPSFPTQIQCFWKLFFDSQLALNINTCVPEAEPLGISHFAYLLSIHAIVRKKTQLPDVPRCLARSYPSDYTNE